MELDRICDIQSQYSGQIYSFYNQDALLGDAGQRNHRYPKKPGI